MANNKPLPELKVLRPRDPTFEDENQWPIFRLRNVEVVSKDGELANLLHAGPSYPVTLVGTLDNVERSLSHHRKFSASAWCPKSHWKGFKAD
jgi:hypothetical protein